MKKVIYIDRGLARQIGHHYTYCKNIAKELVGRGQVFEIHGFNATLNLNDIPNFFSTFEDYQYCVVNSHNLNDIVTRIAKRIFQIVSNPHPAVIFIPNCSFIEVIAVWMVNRSVQFRQHHFKLILRMGSDQMLSDSVKFGEAGLEILRELASHTNISLYTDTSDATVHWSNLSIPTTQFPFPTDKTTKTELPSTQALKNINANRFLYIGQGGKHKGIHHILEALLELNSRDIKISATIQHFFYDIDPKVIEALPTVKFINRELSSEEYDELIDSSTHIFSYYDPSTYTVGSSSNVLIETLTNNRIPIVSPFRHAFEFLGCDYNLFGTKFWNKESLVALLSEITTTPPSNDCLKRIWARSSLVSGISYAVDVILR